jgi:hypothetical protein
MRQSLCSEGQIYINGSCSSCLSGKIASNLVTKALDSCEVLCDLGSIWNGEKCINCTAGKYAKESAQTCDLCATGRYSKDLSQNAECSLCESGKYVSSEGKSSCAICDAGSFSNIGFSSCIDCPSGFYSQGNSSSCILCSSGKFSDAPKSSFCQDCGANTATLQPGSVTKANCFCNSGFYGRPYDGTDCCKCSELDQFKCDSNSSYPRILGGYFRSPADPAIALECIPKEACLPTDSNALTTSCSSGYTGWLCGSCVLFEYYKIGSTCHECPSLLSRVFSYLAIVFAILFFIWKFTQIQNFANILDLKIFIFWIQIIALYPQMSSSWPEELARFFQILSFISLDIELTSPGK